MMPRDKSGAALVGLLILALSASATHAVVSTFDAVLTGLDVNPPVVTTGTGSVTVTHDSVTHVLSVDVNFSDLIGPTTASHIHCCILPPANVGLASESPSFLGFPLGVTSGLFFGTRDLTLVSSFSAAFLVSNGGTPAGAEAALVSGMAAGMAYFDIHTTFRPGGEIRAFLVQRQSVFTGTVFNDLNRNGVSDPGEPGVPGVVVTFDRGADDTVDEQAITNASGDYNAATFISDTYRLRIVLPAGFIQTTANPPDFVSADFGVSTFDADFGIAALSVEEIPALGDWAAIVFAAALVAAAWIVRRPSAGHSRR